jgi:hypothetical protein
MGGKVAVDANRSRANIRTGDTTCSVAGSAMKHGKYWAVAVAVVMPLAAVGYLVWVYYSTKAEIGRQSLSGTISDPADRWFGSDPVDPADLHGTWTSRLENREYVLDFRPDGKLVWTIRVTVGDMPPTDIVERYEYMFEPGRFLVTTLTERSFDGKAIVLGEADRVPKFWKLDWKADDKSSFQLRTDPQDKGRPHYLFRKSPPGDGKKG